MLTSDHHQHQIFPGTLELCAVISMNMAAFTDTWNTNRQQSENGVRSGNPVGTPDHNLTGIVDDASA